MADLNRKDLIALYAQTQAAISNKATAKEILSLLEPMLTGVQEQVLTDTQRIENCQYCQNIAAASGSFYPAIPTAINPDEPLPEDAIKIIPEEIYQPGSRVSETFRCAECKTPYLYQSDYEAEGMGGNDDFEYLLRLCIGEHLQFAYTMIEKDKRLQPMLNTNLDTIIRLADLGNDKQVK